MKKEILKMKMAEKGDLFYGTSKSKNFKPLGSNYVVYGVLEMVKKNRPFHFSLKSHYLLMVWKKLNFLFRIVQFTTKWALNF